MKRLGQNDLDKYLYHDWIQERLTIASKEGDEALTSHRWLIETPAKRLVYAELYQDLVHGNGAHVLDVGGGLCSLTRCLAGSHSYEVVDLIAHDKPDDVARFLASAPSVTLHPVDWYSMNLAGSSYDVVIANDLFPNVDQRLELFLHKFLPTAREVRLSLTYYNQPRFYLSRRIDGSEILCVLAWNGQMTRAALAPFADRILNPSFEVFDAHEDSMFGNKRQTCIVSLRGDLANV